VNGATIVKQLTANELANYCIAHSADPKRTDDWNIEDRYCVFGKNFEETLRKSFSKYEQLENQARDEIGDSKPLIGRYVAEQLDKNNDIGWKKFEQLKKKIYNLS
jgi:hypothetical protein